jgi:serine/threonine protein kinase
MPTAPQYRNALPVQAMLHEYRIEQVLGVGGFGITYLARDTHLDKLVALKEYLPSELALRTGDGTVQPQNTEREADYRWGLDRFLQEARTLAKFGHPHIVRVARYFEANATAYMVMEYEHGEPLKSMLVTTPRMDEATLRRILDPILDGLAAVHAAGFLHRDIKPDNIFIRSNGSPVLIDFGSARNALGGETRALTAVLTPGYAPLEQYAADGHQGPWTDLYALGAVLYQAASGLKPPDAVTRMRGDIVPETLAKLRGGPHSAEFVAAIEWALKVDEKQRPQSVAEWRAAFAPGGKVPDAYPPTVRVAPQSDEATLRIEPPAKRKPWLIYGVIGAVIVLAGAGVAIFGGKPRQGGEPARQAAVTPAAAEKPPEKQPGAQDGEWAADFKGADNNKDGFLSHREAREFPHLARNFEQMDADKDGRISQSEFRHWRAQQAERRSERRKN